MQQADNILTALAGPRVEDLVGVASSVGEESVLAVVVEGAGVVQRRVVSVPLSVTTVLAFSCKCRTRANIDNTICLQPSIVPVPMMFPIATLCIRVAGIYLCNFFANNVDHG